MEKKTKQEERGERRRLNDEICRAMRGGRLPKRKAIAADIARLLYPDIAPPPPPSQPSVLDPGHTTVDPVFEITGVRGES